MRSIQHRFTAMPPGRAMRAALSLIWSWRLLLTVLFGSVSVAALAQEGHPYVGTWRGEATAGSESIPLVIIINYDGDNLTGLINPGRNSFPFQTVEHDAPSWTLTVTATNRQNEAVTFNAVMRDIGSTSRFMEGSWNQAGKEYEFRIRRE